MYIQVQEATIKAIQIVQFKGYSCDETLIIDNDSWIDVHAYVIQFWTRVFCFVLCWMDCAWLGSNNLTKVITFVLVKVGGLTREKLLNKLCFGVDGVSKF
jgi:hypothetical protein